ncbi:sacsin N-terminal ATP-binding-like domain-containing protein [Chryseobacterium indoltheticum]|uniref:sacsin N-terminal ATP-binding-like domain-containing protein n=1 Tax=Chryseobacterium indoltheticum TaxID=254 RepID=UPI004042EF6E
MIKSIEIGRKEDGNRSIADKIIKRIHDLEKTVQNNHGRWAWELLQNAKDSVAENNRKVSVLIEFSGDCIKFSHNGDHFTEKDIRGLINQISSKEVDEGKISTRTGRFGTGFLTTHLLSKEVFIKGIVETSDGDLYRFGFPLNRNGNTTSSLIPNIENAWTEFHSSTENNRIKKYDEDQYNTSFAYTLDKDQKKIAEIGVKEFTELIPYVLAFIPKIKSVKIVDKVKNSDLEFLNTDKIIEGFKKIRKIENGEHKIVRIIYSTDGHVSIAARAVKKTDGSYQLFSLKNIPKIFCDFPLIGTENFHFPIVVNSFFFNPQTERDGIWLTNGANDPEVNENKELILRALTLYKQLIDSIGNKPFTQIYHISNTNIPETDERYFDSSWYKISIQKPLRTFLLTKSIIDYEDGSKGRLSETWFPLKAYNKEIREKLWQYTFDLFPTAVCRKEDLTHWMELIWEDIQKITYGVLIDDIAGSKSISELSHYFDKDENLTFDWLNEVGNFLMKDEANLSLFQKKAIIPNVNKKFAIKSSLYLDEINDDNLILILKLLGLDWNNILLHKNVNFGEFEEKNKKDIARNIVEKLKNTNNSSPDLIEAITILSEWFDNNSQEGHDLFGETYKKRAELFMNTIEDKESLYKVMRSSTNLSQLSKVVEAMEDDPKIFHNLEGTKEIFALLKQHSVEDINQLRDLLENRPVRKSLLPITEDIITSMGITNLDDWQEAMDDKDLAAIYNHKSTPTREMFIYAQGLIKKAKQNIIKHLRTLDDYNLDNLDESTATTVLAGILKDGRELSIVARPAYNGEVIIYYGSERNTLDYIPSELWVDDGNLPRKITLGHILKQAKIVKFPI